LQKERVDSELFGHVKGSFTGPVQNQAGRIRQAQGGTIFLDEIGDLPASCWGNVLRFLQNKEVHPLGGDTAVVDVRILAATNKPERIPAEARHRFEHALHLPPLRARRQDIPKLAKTFFLASKRMPGRTSLRFSKQELSRLAQHGYDWPGNIRQLEKAIRRSVALHPSGRSLTADEVIAAAKALADSF